MGAIGKDATEVIAAMYRAVLEGDVYEVSSPAVAEMEKILENTYRNINIGLVNELAMLCNRRKIPTFITKKGSSPICAISGLRSTSGAKKALTLIKKNNPIGNI